VYTNRFSFVSNPQCSASHTVLIHNDVFFTQRFSKSCCCIYTNEPRSSVKWRLLVYAAAAVTLSLLIKNTAARYQPLPFVDQPQRHSIVRCCIGPTLVLTAAAAAAVPTAFRQPDLLCTLYDILMSHPSPICVANAVTTCVSFYEFTVQRHYK